MSRIWKTASIVMISLACCHWICAAQEPEGALGLRVRPLFYRYTRAEVPIPLEVTLSNADAQFNGAIEARIGGHCWRREISVGKGMFRFILYPKIGEFNPEAVVKVNLIDEKGRAHESRSIPLRAEEKRRLVLSVTVKVSSASALSPSSKASKSSMAVSGASSATVTGAIPSSVTTGGSFTVDTVTLTVAGGDSAVPSVIV